MNWVGGARSRVKISKDRLKQQKFFEDRKRAAAVAQAVLGNASREHKTARPLLEISSNEISSNEISSNEISSNELGGSLDLPSDACSNDENGLEDLYRFREQWAATAASGGAGADLERLKQLEIAHAQTQQYRMPPTLPATRLGRRTFVDLGRAAPAEVELELPMSPIHSPSRLELEAAQEPVVQTKVVHQTPGPAAAKTRFSAVQTGPAIDKERESTAVERLMAVRLRMEAAVPSQPAMAAATTSATPAVAAFESGPSFAVSEPTPDQAISDATIARQLPQHVPSCSVALPSVPSAEDWIPPQLFARFSKRQALNSPPSPVPEKKDLQQELDAALSFVTWQRVVLRCLRDDTR
ncbi:hypothetical protein CAOG_03733 [Capsaspora owczarzaki ATCC 30864]|uniref:Uncharacterized protein n=1 Tax=Capsaspora owczarzaki (strain ATCC 30864) TaxID=595528 RepID=A0A0D2UCQ8_CAPO3|nr:hypothetical protein CAOG_03733 [Capsaspora owczarzaki ATCC 30864]KJE92836.1 hypothetical protein CAOG_003733 [Capsaspora owczarzaki ATCC 30864]|eukprot:XP_004363461.1 hypothetical protein CAOG_03733 [Capsaspora owczarzaki ATCC 30864]